ENIMNYLIMFPAKPTFGTPETFGTFGTSPYFCTLMKKRGRIYSAMHRISAIVMLVALVWLTISVPFVFSAQQQLKKIEQQANADQSKTNSEENNPFASTTEEKAPGNINLSEEYLHHHEENEHPWFSIVTQHRNF